MNRRVGACVKTTQEQYLRFKKNQQKKLEESDFDRRPTTDQFIR